ncbi:MAG: UbiA family prenyltransferase [Pseudomonadota bacterium]|nr:UbiA family prenyltransferase [Gammaproteobacteria bacterium]MDQ3582769.1 UbiA family prenyltransferase [Pseudomonadota bacterium]
MHAINAGVTRPADPVPLCVDLDGTLIRSDLFVESLFALLRKNVAYLFLIPVWLMRGKAYLKHQIAQRVDLDVTLLPYHGPFLKYLREQRAAGRRLVLVTATHQKYAREVAAYLDLFENVLATDDTTNLSGTYKHARLTADYGAHGYDYAGNSRKDLEVWSEARRAVVVAPDRGVKAGAERLATLERSFDEGKAASIKDYLRAMRPHQWIKNLLVFVPLIGSHKVHDLALLLDAALAFSSFSLCAASVYLLNDLLDLDADRHHAQKRRRPFAAGRISVVRGSLLIPVTLILAFALALMTLPPAFGAALGVYYLMTVAYSLRLKRVLMLDVVVLAGLYSIRIVAGTLAIAETHSFWLLAFSMFIFLSLAMAKRCAELSAMQSLAEDRVKGRGYRRGDLEMVQSLGASSGQIAVLVLALYIVQDGGYAAYSRPEVLWLLCPLLLYWIGRVWIFAHRGWLHEDPVVFALRDRLSWWIGASALVIIWLAI